MGAFPYHFTPEGMMAFKLLHPVTAYSLLIQTFITITAGLRQLFFLTNIGRSAKDLARPDAVLMSTFLLVYLPSLLVPFTHWPETNRKIRFLNEYALFQMEFYEVTKRPLTFRIKPWVNLALLICAVFTITQDTLYYNKIATSGQWWIFPVFVFCTFFLSLVIILWVGICASLYVAAKTLTKVMKKEFQDHGFWRAEEIAKYRKLWLRLCGLVRGLGDSLAFTMGCHMVVIFAAPVLCLYYFLLIASTEESHYVMRGIVLPFYGFFCVFVSCIAAQEIALQVGAKFRDEIEEMETQFRTRTILVEEEIQKFLNAIHYHSPAISLGGFTDVDARLVVSFMSCLMTYMVVLIQLNISQQTPEKYRPVNTTTCIS